MSNYTVYVHINRVNGKRYVGVTSQPPEERWQNGLGYRHNKHFWDAIKKYGWSSFEHVVVADRLERETALDMERSLIAEYRTQNKAYGYNITDGGEHFNHTQASKDLMSQRRRGKGLHTFSEEHKRRIREHHAGGNAPRAVICIETGERFNSINDAVRATGASKYGISNCCHKKPHYNTAGGYHWSFAK